MALLLTWTWMTSRCWDVDDDVVVGIPTPLPLIKITSSPWRAPMDVGILYSFQSDLQKDEA
jgi:hypothetical protein